MIAAHPSPQIAHHLESDFERHLESMISSPLAHFVNHGVGAGPVEKIEHLPGAVNPVPDKLVYVQSQDGALTKLTLAWKLEVEMEDNWYEAYMDAMYPSHIHSVIDWASDAAIAPIPKTPIPTYNVWKWGINDPTEGTRSLESGYDKIASPIGWHSIPAGNDPLSPNPGDPSQLINYTTTWGNNVCSLCFILR
jgi:extracellular elastinolytic metalloproteinase